MVREDVEDGGVAGAAAGKKTLDGFSFFSAMRSFALATAGLTPSVGVTAVEVVGRVVPAWAKPTGVDAGRAGEGGAGAETSGETPEGLEGPAGARAPTDRSPREERIITKVTRVTVRSITRRSAISAGHTPPST